MGRCDHRVGERGRDALRGIGLTDAFEARPDARTADSLAYLIASAPAASRRPQPQKPSEGTTHLMFVFKAAVVGGGTMGGQIAQTIAAADIPVVVKDVKQEFVDAALETAK